MRASLGAVVLLVSSCVVVDAIFIQPELESVPVARLTQNLERMSAQEPQNAQLLLNLARAHAMAYATRSERVEIAKGDERSGVYSFPVGESNLQLPNPPADKAGETDAARAHLRSAIGAYERVLRVDPTMHVARLGLGWCLLQAGDRLRASQELRTLVERAWPDERTPPESDAAFRTKSLRFAFRMRITEEGIGYLIPLLDPVRDRDEIASLTRINVEASNRPRAITPLAIPLRDGVAPDAMLDRRAHVRFDADGSGLDREWTWITPDAGWLVYDRAGTGRVSSALQLFGSVTFWMFWDNGYEALRALDDDANGSLSGDELKGLGIWRDEDGDGVSDPGEVQPLAYWGVVSVSCAYESDDESDVAIASSRPGVTFTDGSTRPTYDLILERQR